MVSSSHEKSALDRSALAQLHPCCDYLYLINSFRNGADGVGHRDPQLRGGGVIRQEVDQSRNDALFNDPVLLTVAADQKTSQVSGSRE